MKTILQKHRILLIDALRARLDHCRTVLLNVALASDVKFDDQMFYSKEKELHFSVRAYKAMLTAIGHLTNECPDINEFTALQLNQMIKAMGEVNSPNRELIEYLVDQHAILCTKP